MPDGTVAQEDGFYLKSIRSGSQRRPEMRVVAWTPKGKAPVKVRQKWNAKNYQSVMAAHDPADADLYAAAFARFLRDTKEYRDQRALKTHLAAATKSAHCHKVGWLRERKGFDGNECLFFPSMVPHRPETVKYNCRDMAAARAMLLMTQGLPPEGKPLAIHCCGNGHWSCVNPKHLRWGDQADNARDKQAHNAPSEFMRGMDPALVDEIRNSPELVKVIAWRTGVPAGVVSAIKTGAQF